MIKWSVERRALPREVINLPAMLSFDRIGGVHPCVVRNINAFGACLSTPYYMFARDFDLSFSGFHRTLACRVVWRRATISGVVFGLRRRAPKLASVKAELASIIQLNLPNALPPLRSVELDVCLPEWERRPVDRYATQGFPLLLMCIDLIVCHQIRQAARRQPRCGALADRIGLSSMATLFARDVGLGSRTVLTDAETRLPVFPCQRTL